MVIGAIATNFGTKEDAKSTDVMRPVLATRASSARSQISLQTNYSKCNDMGMIESKSMMKDEEATR